MIEVKLDKDYYHLQADMERWCIENIGPGMWGISIGCPIVFGLYLVGFGLPHFILEKINRLACFY